jgi:glycosyltransferase involved in cell wall biosynthesis
MRGETILCIATRVWDSLWRDSQQIMSRMAQQNQVLYFEPGRNPDRSHMSEMRRNLPNFAALRPRTVAPNLTVIPTPSSLPYARKNLPATVLQATTPAVANVNTAIIALQVRRAMRMFKVKSPILWLYEPRQIGLAGMFGEKLVCYYNYDEMSGFAGNERISELLRHYDERMCLRADVIFSTSRGQWEKRRKLNPNTYFIPNGVDFELFNRALDPATAVATDLTGIKKPIIGYAGWLGYQIDPALLVRVARAYPQCSLVLVGPDSLPPSDASEQLHHMSNVHFLGQKELHHLPGYLKAFDVALIPYKVGGHVLTVYPLKLHEYLASGRAIVATALPELRAFSDTVRIAEEDDHFIAQIGQALEDNSPQAVAARVAVARENTWDRRVLDIYKSLEERLLPAQERRAS